MVHESELVRRKFVGEPSEQQYVVQSFDCLHAELCEVVLNS